MTIDIRNKIENENLFKKENRPLKTLKTSLNFVSSKALQMITKD